MPMRTFADFEAVLADALPGYESRAPQQRLAEGVERVFTKPEHFTAYTGPDEDYPDWTRPGLCHFLGQAGTGTGKSLGYLIPALLSGKRVVVSVTTKALQSQLASKDMPFLSKHLDRPISWTVLKGRSNYLCINRLALVTANDVPELPRITALIQGDPDFDGERDTITQALGGEVAYTSWNLIAAESEECADNNCDPNTCYAEKARKRARESQVIIVNHALFFTDLSLKSYGKGGMLGEYDAVVFDEAHEMEEVAGSTLGGSLSEGAFASLTNQVRRWAREYADDDGDSLNAPITNLSGAVQDLFPVLEEGRLTDGKIEAAAEQFGEIYTALAAFRTALYETAIEHTSDHDRAYKRKRSLMRLANSVEDRLVTIITGAQTEHVRWIEIERTRRGESRSVIKIAPIKVAPFLYRWLFSKTPCVLVSATLAVKGSFDFICQRLGIPMHEGIDVGTPFDYPTQGRIYVPVHLPEPKGADQGEWQAMATNEISRLVRASRGRALVLFTSVAHMRQSAAALKVMNSDLDFKMQYDAPTGELTAWLKDHAEGQPGRVLLATKSFFTGVDIPGEALSLVVVTKMPFPRPGEALTDARCEAIEAAGGNAFGDYTIPVMSLVLQQATGRLIRHRSDRGVVAILDPRMVSKGYGKRILSDLPPMARVTDLTQVEEFLA